MESGGPFDPACPGANAESGTRSASGSGGDEPIAALATPAGTAALAVIRATGRGVGALATSLAPKKRSHREALHARYIDVNGGLVDDVVFTFFAGPKSYTGEDVLEISAHGNPYIAQRILEDLYARGCRPAEPGEFTRRAFLNGKLDLSQAEAVMDVIAARSERALASAQRQLRGALARQMDALSRALIAALAQVEAYIDFPEEDLPEENRAALRASLGGLLAATARLIATQHYGEVLRDGLKVAIVGATNAGKSSLFNRLVGSDRAIVSPEPGTTRDFIEERILAGPHALRLIDTAGLNAAPGGIERLGIAKTWERVADADILLVVLDGAARPEPLDPELAARNPLVVLNKADLPHSARAGAIAVSAATGDGLEALRAALIERADAIAPQTGEDAVAINARHAHALAQARDALASALSQLDGPHDPALLASDLRGALDAFGQIGGKIDHERVLDELFATFCIGK